MAISCKCPHCVTTYRLKDEFAGKKVTCKNAACRKLFEVPKPPPAPVAKPLDVDALAAATFADEPVVVKKVETTVKVTCAGCDHVWEVESSKAGKNVQCPECGKVNKVPVPKVEAKLDWRSTNDGKPTLARRDTGPKVEGAWDARETSVISQQTAKKMVDEELSEEEPEVVRKRWIKRGVYGTLLVAVLGYGGYYLYSSRKVGKMDANIADALKEVRNPEDGAKDPKFHALILRASGEFHTRASQSRAETDAALNDFKAARNAFPVSPDPSVDRAMMLSDVATSMAGLLGTEEEAEKGRKIVREALLKEIRQTIDRMQTADPEPIYELLRTLTREFHKQKQGMMATQLAIQKFTSDTLEGQEALGYVGIELFRLGDAETAKEVLKKVTKTDASSIQALRMLLNMPPTEAPAAPPGKGPAKGPAPKDAGLPQPTQTAIIITAAIRGEWSKVKTGITGGVSPDRAKAIVLAAEYGIPLDGKSAAAPEVGELLDVVIGKNYLGGDSKNTFSPWVTVKACRVLGKIGKGERAYEVANLTSNIQAGDWAKVEALRGRLNADPTAKVEETWADGVGDAPKSLAAAKARELVARQNAGIDNSFQRAVNAWPKGTVRPFGTAGLVLGQQDRTLR